MYGNTNVRKAGTIIRRAQAVALHRRGRMNLLATTDACSSPELKVIWVVEHIMRLRTARMPFVFHVWDDSTLKRKAQRISQQSFTRLRETCIYADLCRRGPVQATP